jgi:hypothetical protein
LSDQSTGKSLTGDCRDAGDESRLGRNTIIEIVDEECERPITARRERARAVLDGASEAELVLLGPAAVEPGAATRALSDLRWENMRWRAGNLGFPREFDRPESGPALEIEFSNRAESTTILLSTTTNNDRLRDCGSPAHARRCSSTGRSRGAASIKK